MELIAPRDTLARATDGGPQPSTPRLPPKGSLREVKLSGTFPLAHTGSAVVIVHVTFGRGVLGPAVARRVRGATRARGAIAGVAVTRLLTARGVAAESVHSPRVAAFVRARSARGLRSTVLLPAGVAISGATGRACTAARLAVPVSLRASRRSALRRRRLSARHRALHLHALTEHVVVAVLQHSLRGLISLKRDESETAALMVMRVSHHEHLSRRPSSGQSTIRGSALVEIATVSRKP